MKREKARLEHLRTMPYEDYLQTPQWQETQKVALKWAGNRCQVCKAENVNLNAYHTTYENLGCEQQGDVITLCEACYDRLSGKLAGSVDTPGEPEEETDPGFSFTKKAAVFVPSAIVGLGLPALLHAPLPAELFGFAAAIALAVNSPRIYAEMRGSLPAPLVEFLDARTQRKREREAVGEWSWGDRLLGRHLHGDVPSDEQEATAPGGEENGQTENGQELRGLVKLAQQLHVPLIDIAGKALFVVGMRRSGKSTLAALLAEQLGQYLLPMLIPDFEGDLLSLAEVLPRALIMHGPLSDATKYQHERQRVLTLQVNVQAAPKWGYAIFEKGYQVLLDLASYCTLEEAIAIQIALIRGMFKWAEEHPDGRTTSLVYLDEAQRYLPESLKDSVIQDKALVGELLRAYSDIVAIGGKRGIAPVIITQRMAQVNKKIVNQSEVFFVLRQTSDNDLDRVMDYVNKDTATRQQISKFAQGQGVYIAFDGMQLLTRFEHRASSGKRSETPDAQAAQRYIHVPMELTADQLPARPSQNQSATVRTRVPEPSREATIDALLQLQGMVDEQTFQALLDMLPTIRTEDEDEKEEAKALVTRKLPDDQATNGPTTDHPRLREVPRKAEGAASLRHSRAGLPKVLRGALDAYEPGMTYRELGAKLGYDDSRVRDIFSELKSRGLLRVVEGATPGQIEAVQSQRSHLHSLSRPGAAPAPIDPADLAKAFALWQSGASSVRKLETAAKTTGYGWSNGKCRTLIEAMEKRKLIPKREAGVM